VSSMFSAPDSSKKKGLQDSLPVDIQDFTEEERQEITSQIDKIARGSSLRKGEAFAQLQPQKKGNVFPLAVNILAVVVIAAGVYLSNYYFNQRIEQLNIETSTIQGAEGKILEEVKRAAEQKIREKESEISKIKEDLSLIEQQRLTLQNNMQQQIAAKEQELQAQLDAALQSERDRLEASGVSVEQVRAQLENFRVKQEQAYLSTIETFRAESMEQLRQKEVELTEAKATAERILEDANRGREELLAGAKKREEELQEQFLEEKAQLTQQSSETREELRKLEDAKRNEQLFRDQINGLYLDIQTGIDQKNAEEARAKIGELRALLQSPSVRGIPNLAKRVEVDSFMIDLLETEAAGASGQKSDESLLESAKMITALRSTVQEARTLQEQGNLYDARRYYNQALEMIPAVSLAVNESRNIRISEEAAEIQGIIAEGDQAVSAGNSDRAVELYADAAIEASTDHSGLNRTATDKMIQLMRQELADYTQRSEELSGRIERLQNEIASAERDSERQEREGLDTRASLNETIEQKDSRITSLQSTIQSKEQEISELKSDLTRLEEDRVQLVAQYREAELKVRKLNGELEGAVDQITELIIQSESNSRLREAVNRYQEFELRSTPLISSGNPEDRSAAVEEFKQFIGSKAVKDIFPQLPDLYRSLETE